MIFYHRSTAPLLDKQSMNCHFLDGPGLFSITERAKGHPHTVSFDVKLCEKVNSLLHNAKAARRDVGFRETLHSNGVSVLLTRGWNESGWFIKITKWQKDQ